MRVLVLAGGSPHAHDFADVGAALGNLVAAHGHPVESADSPDAAAARISDPHAPGIDALVVAGLWWRMEGPVYDRWRPDHAYSPPQTTRAALSGFVRRGGGLVALHTTPICFDDWPEWGQVVGGAWRWGVSGHPPYGPVRAHVVANHPVVAGLPEVIDLDDEVYGDLDVGEVEVLVRARRSADDADQPVVWAHTYGAGRVVFDCFGHDRASIEHPHNARLIGQAIEWTGAAA